MKISVQELQHSHHSDKISSEMDYLIGKLQSNYIGRCRHRMRSSPYCVVKHLKTHSLINDSSFISSSRSSSSSPHLVPKCSKCLSRNCTCVGETSKHSALTNSVTLLKELLREKTLIQEAVRRLQTRTSPTPEGFQFDYDNGETRSHPSATYTSYESESESDVEN